MDIIISKLSYKWNIRKGGGGKTERKYIDFYIDQKNLKECLQQTDIDYIGSLGWSNYQNDKLIIQRYLLKTDFDIEKTKRFLLYICPECGDIGCGSETFKIEKSSEYFIWKEFGFENNYEDEIKNKIDISFYFDKHEYFELFNKLEKELGVYYK
jgi:hypothetical protein